MTRRSPPRKLELRIASALYNWALISLAAYRHPENPEYRDTLEEAAQDLEAALAEGSPWIRRLLRP